MKNEEVAPGDSLGSIFFRVGSEELIRLEKGKFFWKGEEVSDAHQVYEKFREFLSEAEVIEKPPQGEKEINRLRAQIEWMKEVARQAIERYLDVDAPRERYFLEILRDIVRKESPHE